MKITARVTKLEGRWRPEGCPACGGIDPKTRSGPFYPGIVLHDCEGSEDAECMCKWCGCSFRAKLTPLDEGGFMARDVQPGVLGI